MIIENEDKEIKESIVPQNILKWYEQEADILFKSINQDLDINNHKIMLKDLKEPLIFYDFLKVFKLRIKYNNSVIPTPTDDLINIIEEIKFYYNNIVKPRLLDGVRKFVSVIHFYEIENKNLKIEINKLQEEAKKMLEDIKNIENVKLREKNLIEFTDVLLKRLDLISKEYIEELSRVTDRTLKEYNLAKKTKTEVEV